MDLHVIASAFVVPHSSRKTPMVVSRKALSLKILKSGSTLPPTLGGKRTRTVKLATISRRMKMNPITLVAHAKPIFGKRFCSINGKMMPPKEPPLAAMPVAFPRLTRNQ